MKTLYLFLAMLFSLHVSAQSPYKAGEKIVINKKVNDDLYAAGGEIQLLAAVEGDLVVAGGDLNFADTVKGDLIVAGGDITLGGHVSDDVRIAGGDITVTGTIRDDLIVFGGQLSIDEEAVISGNLIIFGGQVDLNGIVEGDLRAKAGTVYFNGTVDRNFEVSAREIFIDGSIGGKSTIAAQELVLGNDASFKGDIAYWSEERDIDFTAFQKSGKTTFDESLAPERGLFDFRYMGIVAFGLILAYLVAVFLLLLIANGFLKNYFAQAAGQLDQQFVRCFGLGVLYLLGLPVAIFLLITMLVTIPIAIPLAMIYGLTIFYGHVVAGLLLSHFIRNKYYPGWSDRKVLWAALGIVVILRILSFIPFLGWVISMAVIASSVGAFIADYRKRGTPAPSV